MDMHEYERGYFEATAGLDARTYGNAFEDDSYMEGYLDAIDLQRNDWFLRCN